MCSRNTTNIGYRSIFPDKVSTFSQKKNEDHKTKCGLQAFFFFKERACIHPLRKESQAYKQNENLSSLGASADCLQEIRS